MPVRRRGRHGVSTTAVLLWTSIVGVGVGGIGAALPKGLPPTGEGLWQATAVRGVSAEYYSSMRSMALAADAVVLGSLRSIDSGPVYGERGARSHYAAIRINVEEVLQGSLLQGNWVLHHPTGDRDRVEELRHFISEDRAVYFLRDLEQEMLDLGFGAAQAREVEGAYRLVTNGAVINDARGIAVRPLKNEDALASLEGLDFDNAVARIRNLSD